MSSYGGGGEDGDGDDEVDVEEDVLGGREKYMGFACAKLDLSLVEAKTRWVSMELGADHCMVTGE